MANFQATLAGYRANTPQILAKANEQNARVRVFRAKYTAPAAGMPQIGDVIQWGYLPKGAIILQGKLNYSAGTAACTINLGDVQSAARYLAATAINAAGATAVLPVNQTNGGADYEVATPNPGGSNDDSEIRSVVAGAQIAAGQVINLTLLYVDNS